MKQYGTVVSIVTSLGGLVVYFLGETVGSDALAHAGWLLMGIGIGLAVSL